MKVPAFSLIFCFVNGLLSGILVSYIIAVSGAQEWSISLPLKFWEERPIVKIIPRNEPPKNL